MKLRSLSVLSACAAALALALQAKFGHPAAAKLTSDMLRTPPELRRAAEQTYLTYPEWYLVWSPNEYADVMADRPPSSFPYLGHIGQFWQGYRAVYGATKDDYPFNGGYHLMIVVIGTSMAGEYVWKWGYENLIGRMSETTRRHGMTAEEHLAADVARRYVTFLDGEPFYKFDYVTPLRDLWTKTGWWGPDPIRKWERKYYLTSEYAAKIAYSWLIRKSSESVYGAQEEVTTVVMDRLPANLAMPAIRVLEQFSDGSLLANLPRYQAFTRTTSELAKANVNFLEIAGNNSEIAVSAIVPASFDLTGLKVIALQPIITRPGNQRMLFTVPVPNLGETLRKLNQPEIQLEHIYDY